MSEPVTNAEIEDVLSSIRRLVSEDTRKVAREEPVAEEPAMPDRLVLTPSLRVAEALDEDDTYEEPETDLIEEPDQATEEDTYVLGAHEAADLEDEAEVEEIPLEGHVPETEARNEAPWSDPEATLYEAAAEFEQEDSIEFHEDSQEEIADLSEDESPETAHDEAETDDQWDHAVAEDNDQDDEDQTDAIDVDVTAFLSPDNEGEEEQPAEDLEAFSWQDDGTEEASAELDDEPAEAEPDLAGAVEAVSAAMDETLRGDWEVQEEETAHSPLPETEALEWRDVEGTVEPLSQPEQPQQMADMAYVDEDVDDEEDDADLFAEDEAILDEATLRELVTDIVREELQGALGERITRNVRKLVRREINRALSVQDLE